MPDFIFCNETWNVIRLIQKVKWKDFEILTMKHNIKSGAVF